MLTFEPKELITLLESFNVAHLCGSGKVDESLKNQSGYAHFEYIGEEMKDFFALANLIISRAGANSIFEIVSLAKPNILIPLSANASRGDQILNAKSFEKQGFSIVLNEDGASADDLVKAVSNLYSQKNKYIDAMKSSNFGSGVGSIIQIIKELAK